MCVFVCVYRCVHLHGEQTWSTENGSPMLLLPVSALIKLFKQPPAFRIQIKGSNKENKKVGIFPCLTESLKTHGTIEESVFIVSLKSCCSRGSLCRSGREMKLTLRTVGSSLHVTTSSAWWNGHVAFLQQWMLNHPHSSIALVISCCRLKTL